MTAPWSASTTSSQVQFDPAALSTVSFAVGQPLGWLYWPVTTTVQNWLSGAQPNDGLLAKDAAEPLGSGGIAVPSSSYAASTAVQPELQVTYTGDAVTLLPPATLHSNGAELDWTGYTGPSGAPFQQYAIYRSMTPNFTPSPSTLLTTITDPAVTSYRDTTAAPSRAFTYAVVANTSTSNEVTVTLPADGLATKTLQPGPSDAQDTFIYDASGMVNCANYGADPAIYVGSDTSSVLRGLLRFSLNDIPAAAAISKATLSVWQEYGTSAAVTLEAHRVTRAWTQGTGTNASPQCTGDGATWYDAATGVSWDGQGGDYDGTAAASLAKPASQQPSWDSLDVTGLAQQWAGGAAPNLGVLLKLSSEPATAGNSVIYNSGEFTANPGLRPRLTLTYTDGSHALPPAVSVSGPAPGATVSGTNVTLAAAASDAGAVGHVDFLVDGAVAGTDTAAPYTLSWDSTTAGNGTHTITARAVDTAGNTTTSSPVSVTVNNLAPPAVSITAPAGSLLTPAGPVRVMDTRNGTGGITGPVGAGQTVSLQVIGKNGVPASGVTAVVLNVTATQGTASSYVTVFPDGTARPVTSNLSFTAGETIPNLVVVPVGADGKVDFYNSAGTVQLIADLSGYYTAGSAGDTVSGTVTVTASAAATAPDTVSKVGFYADNQLFATATSSPYTVSWNTLDPANPAYDGAHTLTAKVTDSTGLVTTSAPVTITVANALYRAGVTLTVTNTSTSTLTAAGDTLAYRWYSPDNPAVVTTGPATSLGADLAPGQSATLTMLVPPPTLPAGVNSAAYQLMFDLHDAASGAWFAAKGNPPLTAQVQVLRKSPVGLGLEKYYQYDTQPAGGGLDSLVNVASGNMMLNMTPWKLPGRGLSSVLELTYNGLENHSRSPAGNNWSLAVSSLTRFGTPLEIHPSKADTIAGVSNKLIGVTDGDGTLHVYTGTTNPDGTTSWTPPPGFDVYLRSTTTDTTSPSYWALSRPDHVTFYYNYAGWPTSVTDKNGNTITFTETATPPGEGGPGGPPWRITQVTDPGGRAITVSYYTKAQTDNAHQRGRISDISDHLGHVLHFDYYHDGNLLRLTQRGGTTASGSFLPDRSWVFTYLTSNGSGPAIPSPADRVNPDPRPRTRTP